MVSQLTLKFLKDIKKNNNRPWFEAHRLQFESAKADILLLVEKLIPRIATFDTPIANLAAKECVFRINRDVRFSKDKSPYKSNMACYFNKAGKKGNGAGYYLHLEPGKSFAGGGIWMPTPPDLARIRQEIDYGFDDWKKIIAGSAFKKQFPKGIDDTDILTRPPKGYDEHNPAIGLIKMKSFVVRRQFSDAEVQSSSFVKEVVKTFLAMHPLVAFINKAVD